MVGGSKPLLSLCIPTNGIIEWVFPVLDSIYKQKVSTDLFEVVITSNGHNAEFNEKIEEYSVQHDNLIFKTTDAKQFLNQIEAFKLANGELIKFVNHRMTLLPGSLDYFINFTKKNIGSKPCVYFLNSAMKIIKPIMEFKRFDEYVRGLSYFSSWSAGTAIWKSDFIKFGLKKNFNPLFPHIDFILGERNKEKYIIDNTRLLKELPPENSKKGKYDLFFAFSVEYITILLKMAKSNDISWETFYIVKKATKHFIAEQYLKYVTLKENCSYDVSNFEQSVNVFYSSASIKREALKIECENMIRRIFAQ